MSSFCLCLSVCLSVSLAIFLSMHLSVCVSTCLPFYQAVCLPVYIPSCFFHFIPVLFYFNISAIYNISFQSFGQFSHCPHAVLFLEYLRFFNICVLACLYPRRQHWRYLILIPQRSPFDCKLRPSTISSLFCLWVSRDLN